jgi:hypothetical protein
VDGGNEATTGPCGGHVCGSIAEPPDGSTGVLPMMVDGGDGGEETDSGHPPGTVPISPDGGDGG